jgi:hypothetical protein
VKRIAALAAFALACAHGHAAVTTTVIDLPTQVPTRILDMRPPNAVANIVAVSGGPTGQAGITGPALPAGAVCIPIGRSATGLTDHGLAIVMVDNQYSDVAAVIEYLWNRDHLPIWMHGGSSGSQIVLDRAAGTPATVPLGALLWGPWGIDLGVAATITRPVQIIYHVNDPLASAPAPALYDALTSASAREILGFSGGTTDCGGAYHALTGLDAEWLAATIAFVDKYMPVVPPSGPIAVEYFNAGFGHYFMTADADEIGGLDAGAYNYAFVRTGRQFNVFDAPAAGTVPVCRFFTTPGHFGTRSSHFYTADPVECEGVKHYPDWQYEKIAFHIGVPAGGVCATGTVPVYRMFNNGHTGAPNHRFTTDLALYQQFTTTLGWDQEGIAFCAAP